MWAVGAISGTPNAKQVEARLRWLSRVKLELRWSYTTYVCVVSRNVYTQNNSVWKCPHGVPTHRAEY